MGASGLHWVMATGMGKPAGEDRKIIRSHVMRGKNRRKKMAAGRAERSGGAGSSSSSSSSAAAAEKASSTTASDGDRDPEGGRGGGVEELERALILPPPPVRMGSGTGLEFVSFAEPLEPRMMEHIFKYLTIFAEAVYPAAYCLPENQMSDNWVRMLGNDPAYLNCAIFCALAYEDFTRHTDALSRRSSYDYGTPSSSGSSGSSGGSSSELELSVSTFTALTRTLNSLRQNVETPDRAASDPTLIVVVNLIISSTMAGLSDAARKHLEGLKALVSLRGGLEAIEWNLRRKVVRADLGHSLATGEQPMFRIQGEWMTVTLGEDKLECDPDGYDDVGLRELWTEMRALCELINGALPTGHKIGSRLFHDSLIYLQYRLLGLGHCTPHGAAHHPMDHSSPGGGDTPPALSPWFDPRSPLHNALRLTMLAVASSIWIGIVGVGAFLPYLADELRSSLEFVVRSKAADEDAKMWMLLIWGVTLMKDDDWVVEELARVIPQGSDWEPVKAAVRNEWIWVDGVHDAPGKKLFQNAQRWRTDVLGDGWFRFGGAQVTEANRYSKS